MTSKKITIVGGGIGGLSLAYYLEKHFLNRGLLPNITILEAASDVGGVISTFRQDDLLLEQGPDCFLWEKASIRHLIQNLNMEGELIGTREDDRTSFVLRNQKLIPLPDGFYLTSPVKMIPFLRSPILSWKGKLRTMLEPFIPRGSTIHDETLASFVTRRFGKELLQQIAEPMVAGIYTADANALSLRSTFPRFLELEEQFGSVVLGLKTDRLGTTARGPRYSMFRTPKFGMERLVLKICQALHHTKILTNTPVEKVERRGPRLWNILTKNHELIDSQHLALAVPAHVASNLIQSQKELSGYLSRIPYSSSATANFVYHASQMKNPPKGVGFVVPTSETSNLIGCSFTHKKFEFRAHSDRLIVRAFVGGTRRASLLSKPDEELLDILEQELSTLLDVRGKSQVRVLKRWSQSMPQYPLHHLENVRAIDKASQELGDISLVGNGYLGIGIPDVVARAENAATKIAASA